MSTRPPDDSDDADKTFLMPAPGRGRRPGADAGTPVPPGAAPPAPAPAPPAPPPLPQQAAPAPARQAAPPPAMAPAPPRGAAGAEGGEDETLMASAPRSARRAPPPLQAERGQTTERFSAGERQRSAGPATSPGTRPGGLNPLVQAANPLLNLVSALRAMPQHGDPEALRQQLQQAVRAFEQDGRRAAIPTQALAAARYILCSLLDEAISGTPWGGSGVWAARSLLVTFHNEAFGGEKVFLILQKFMEDPATHIDSLELIYLCLALGFEGRYRVIPNGREQLEVLREQLAQLIRQQRGDTRADLSPHWRGVVDKRNPLVALVPLWVVGAVLAVVLVVLHLGFSMSLASRAEPVFDALHGIKVAAAAAPVAPQKVQLTGQAPSQLATLLKPDVDAGLVAVQEDPTKALISIRGDGLFASASTEVRGEYLPLIQRIGEALKTYPGGVLVTGHTDDQRIVSARFPSNWKLSLERALAVARQLAAATGTADRFRAAGRGESEPLVPNSSPENRARNRRVDILVIRDGTGS